MDKIKYGNKTLFILRYNIYCQGMIDCKPLTDEKIGVDDNYY